MIRECREHGDAPDGYVFPVNPAKLEAVRSALRQDWASAFRQPSATEALVENWTQSFRAAARAHQTPVPAGEFDRVVGVLLGWLSSSRLREMFAEQIATNLERTSAAVRTPTKTWLSATAMADQYESARRMDSIRETAAESVLVELAGEPVDDAELNWKLIPLELEWRVDGLEATEDEVRDLPEASAARVALLMNGDPIEPEIVADRVVPFRAIDRALHMAVGPYVPSLTVPTAEVVSRGRPVLDTTWPTNALMRALGVQLDWTFFAPEDLTRFMDAGGDAEVIRALLRSGEAILCCREEKERDVDEDDEGDEA